MKLQVSVDGIQFGTDIRDIKVPPALRIKRSTGVKAWDDALGGRGLTPSAAVLFSGVPGAGKTTLMIEVACGLNDRGVNVLYNTAEESAYQLRMTHERVVGARDAGFRIGQVGEVHDLLALCDALRRSQPERPFVLIQDSLQALDDGKFKSGRITTATAERVLESITRWTKVRMDDVPDEVAFVNSLIVGQVTKGGGAAGSNKLRHMVDALIHMDVEDDEKSEFYDCRRLYTEKNRFGGAGFLTFMRMLEKGLIIVGQTKNIATGTASATQPILSSNPAGQASVPGQGISLPGVEASDGSEEPDEDDDSEEDE